MSYAHKSCQIYCIIKFFLFIPLIGYLDSSNLIRIAMIAFYYCQKLMTKFEAKRFNNDQDITWTKLLCY